MLLIDSLEARATEAHRSAPCLWTLGVSAAFLSIYSLSNHLTHLRSDVGQGVFEWERAIPFVPWTIVPYLSICGFFVGSFFVGRDPAAFDRHVARLWAALAISIACWAAFPLRFQFDRPATEGAIGLLFRAVSAFDLPYNRAPSMHISVLAILWVRFAPLLRGPWLWALHVWFALIGVSVLTTYQHHVIDVPAGLAVGAASVWLTRRYGVGRLRPVPAPPRCPGPRRCTSCTTHSGRRCGAAG